MSSHNDTFDAGVLAELILQPISNAQSPAHNIHSWSQESPNVIKSSTDSALELPTYSAPSPASPNVFKTLSNSSIALHTYSAPSPLSAHELELFEAIQQTIDLNESNAGPAPTSIELMLFSKLSNKLVKFLTPKKAEEPSGNPFLSILPLATPISAPSVNINNPSISILPLATPFSTPSVNLNMAIPITTNHTDIFSKPGGHLSLDLKELNMRMGIVDKLASKIRSVIPSCLTCSVDQFSTWSKDGSEALSFLLTITNTLSQSGVFKEMWIPAVLNALLNSKILLHFQEYHKLPMASSNAFSFRRESTPEDIAMWTFQAFTAELFRLFRDPRFLQSISLYMASWTPKTFLDIKTALDFFKQIMSQLTLHQHFSGTVADLNANCNLYKHYFWKCVDPLIFTDFTIHCVMATTHLPVDAIEKATFREVDLAFRNYFEYSKSWEKLKSPIDLPPINISKPKNVNSISASNSAPPNSAYYSHGATCTHCMKPGHSVAQCFTLHHEYQKCGKCLKMGHPTRKCPS